MNRNLVSPLIGLLALTGSTAGATSPSWAVQGPILLCFKYSTFQLRDGERVTDFSGSPESVYITLDGPGGPFEISESEIFARPKRRGRALLERDGTSVYKSRGGYGIYGYTSYSPDETQLVISLSGDALRDSVNAPSIYSRFDVRDPQGADCGQTFTYGWDSWIGLHD